MSALILSWLAGFARRFRLWAALALAVVAALVLALRQGRHAAQAQFAINQAEARVRALKAAKEISDDIATLPTDERARRLSRWLRD
jgi:beta-lactamase class A